jgi:DNA-binding NtrC family response regulator
MGLGMRDALSTGTPPEARPRGGMAASGKVGSSTVKRHVIVVDDDEKTLKNIRKILSNGGVVVSSYKNPVRALEEIQKHPYALLITDQRMPHMDGLELLNEAKRISPDIAVILISGYASYDNAVAATKQGAYHYLAKPFAPDRLRRLVEEAISEQALREDAGPKGDRTVEIVGESLGISRVKEAIQRFAPTDCTVLIAGESGTGKELVARSIHASSSRATGPFVACNCGAFSEELIANELFGHEREAYTGAASRRIGLLETASGGTLLLDEISDMPFTMQIKLLRVLQEREIVRVGGTKTIPIDVRIIAATANDLKRAVAENAFRQDLFFRLNVVTVEIPPLRERHEDVLLLAYHFLKRASLKMQKPVQTISPEAARLLTAYAYPGNVRELENIIERAVALCQMSIINERDLPPDLVNLELCSYDRKPHPALTLEEIERDYIRRVLEHTGGSRTKAAEILGIDRTSLWRRMKKFGLDLAK